ncbi:MAG: hypothetical protein JMJ93_03505 [Synergistaceae bacterium]|nr:hypothetical protein [Synergistaceae bacterium]
MPNGIWSWASRERGCRPCLWPGIAIVPVKVADETASSTLETFAAAFNGILARAIDPDDAFHGRRLVFNVSYSVTSRDGAGETPRYGPRRVVPSGNWRSRGLAGPGPLVFCVPLFVFRRRGAGRR